LLSIITPQSAMFSGLNLAFFSLNRLQLEVLTSDGDVHAKKVLRMRRDSNFLLTTILWGNVGINVLLTLLSDSVLTGMSAFIFSTAFITIFGEITPQAYFSRNALRMASMLAPVLRFYQILLYVVAKPCAKFLDMWLGVEGIDYMRERDIREIIKKHVEADEAEVEHIEGIGALNFLQIDDLAVSKEGEDIDPLSLISLHTKLDLPIIPDFTATPQDEFLRRVEKSGHKWVILTDESDIPHLVMDADGFLRAALFQNTETVNFYQYCHRPIIVHDPEMPLGDLLSRLKSDTEEDSDAVIDKDIILLWTEEQKRIITGADILGRLLRGIAAHH
ncbi:DUF21 domain-containing protein, partial [Leucothrix pacifica]|uniref:DUF21 domain-containing protein n=1 Tax=Leucothrix pacifica TaxID=1247513 RepID=UPI001C6439AF